LRAANRPGVQDSWRKTQRTFCCSIILFLFQTLSGPGGSLSNGDGYFLGETLLQNGSIALTFKGLLE
jgi:hypothetical protein